MLEYQMMILEKVSFDKHLFEKELRKSLSLLNTNDLLELRKWASARFERQYPEILRKIFMHPLQVSRLEA
ncbi:hypothetical protein [Hugenholtzia roseola]|uniref:hypothetical protein n=1 Tax=Hugenholtzia roseola TaxID=1002 RepID=UPI0003F4B814|nr:hypothetical protein [Hugenholtzia roseola]